MAREIQFGPWTTGATLYAVLKRSTDGYLRDVVANAWDVPLTADWGDYDVALTEDSTTGHYQATAPSGVTLSDGLVSIIVYQQVGGSPAPTDTYIGEARAVPYVYQAASVSGSVGSVAGAVVGPVAQVSSFTTAGKAEIQAEAEDAITAKASAIADNVLRRQTANVEASSDGDTLDEKSLYGAVAKLVHLIEIAGVTLTVKKSDGTTTLFTQTVTSDATAEPITALGAAT